VDCCIRAQTTELTVRPRVALISVAADRAWTADQQL
jgi:hypothetical protein